MAKLTSCQTDTIEKLSNLASQNKDLNRQALEISHQVDKVKEQINTFNRAYVEEMARLQASMSERYYRTLAKMIKITDRYEQAISELKDSLNALYLRYLLIVDQIIQVENGISIEADNGLKCPKH
jgi:chromosome segregation ATPase